MTVRRAESGDDALVRSVLGRFRGCETAEPADFLDDPRTFLFVAEDDEGLVGWLYAFELVRPEGRRSMLLYEVEVFERAQARGHGRAMVDALLAEARARDHMKVWVLTDEDNDGAKALYTTTGAEGVRQLMYTWELR